MNCAECQAPLGKIEVPGGKWPRQLANRLVCQQCLEHQPSAERPRLELPAALQNPDISAYSEPAVDKAKSWGAGDAVLLTITRSSESALNGHPLAAWAAELLSKKRTVRWAEPEEVPSCAAVLPDFDLVAKSNIPNYAARIRAAVDQGIPLLLVASCSLEKLPDTADHILLKIAIDGKIIDV